MRASIIPGVLFSEYYANKVTKEKIIESIAIAGLICDIVKTNASISGAEVGCQGEVGVAYKVASLVADDDRKVVDVSIDHVSPKTYGKFDCFGICKDDGKLTVLGTSHVFKGAVKSNAQQNCRIMVFDEASNATAKPILKIDENDLMASHGAVVGKINDEHLFYLTSRGISEETAKELITLGYLNPILEGFKEESLKEHISSLIERRM